MRRLPPPRLLPSSHHGGACVGSSSRPLRGLQERVAGPRSQPGRDDSGGMRTRVGVARAPPAPDLGTRPSQRRPTGTGGERLPGPTAVAGELGREPGRGEGPVSQGVQASCWEAGAPQRRGGGAGAGHGVRGEARGRGPPGALPARPNPTLCCRPPGALHRTGSCLRPALLSAGPRERPAGDPRVVWGRGWGENVREAQFCSPCSALALAWTPRWAPWSSPRAVAGPGIGGRAKASVPGEKSGLGLNSGLSDWRRGGGEGGRGGGREGRAREGRAREASGAAAPSLGGRR